MSVQARDYGYFFNSNNHDRTYNAESFEMWLKPFFISGVFLGNFQVTAQAEPDMTVKVAPGYANLNGKPAYWPDENIMEIATASGVYGRYDTIVLRRDNTNREITLDIVTGTASANPSPTPPTRNNDIFELVLAQIYVGVGVTEIKNANITDTRANESICGYVASTVKEMDFEQFANQFNSWVEEFEDTAESDYTLYMNHLRDYLEAYRDVIDGDEQTAAGDYLRFKQQIEDYIDQLEQIIDAGTVAPLQLQVDQLEEDFYASPWRRPDGIMTDQSGNTIEDVNGDPIYITTLSQAEIAAGIINLNAHR